MEWQAAPVSAAPAVLSTETAPNAAASVPRTGDEGPAAATTAEAPPQITQQAPSAEDPSAAAPAAEAEHTPSSNEAEQTPSSVDDDDDGACGVCGSKHSEEEDALIFATGVMSRSINYATIFRMRRRRRPKTGSARPARNYERANATPVL